MSLPSAPDSERAILGSILLSGSLPEVLTAPHFSLDSHRRIYNALAELREDGLEIDSEMLRQHLTARKQIENIGGVAYLAGLTDGALTKIDGHIRIVIEKAQLRGIINLANSAIARALEQSEKPQDILASLERAMQDVAADTHVKEQEIFLDASKFIRQYHEDVQWRVEGAIEVGTNGVMLGMSGDGKSPAARALAVCLATGLPWLDMRVKRCRTALVSREDYAGTTSRFIRRFLKGNGLDDEKLELKHWLWISSRAQVPSLLLDNPADLRLLINNLKRRSVEFCILDVLNVMHSKDENDNTEMRKVLRSIDKIRDEVGCQIMVLHHSRKGVEETTSIAESGRGSSAIAGFAEFKMRIRTEDEEAGIKRIQFKSKAGEGQKAFYWKIIDQAHDEVTLERRPDWTPAGSQKQPARRMVI